MKASWIVTGVAVAVLGLVASQAGAAAMTVGLEFASGQTGQVDAVGQTVTMELYAYMVGVDENLSNDGVSDIWGKLVSGPLGTLQGNLELAPASSVMSGGYQGGTQKTLDDDADLDVGGTNAQVTNDWIRLFAGTGTYAPADGSSGKVFLGTVTFLMTDVAAVEGETTTVNWAYRNKTGLGSGIQSYYLDGVVKAVTGSSTLIAVGEPLTITFIPEPATMAILAIGGLGVLLRRKRTA